MDNELKLIFLGDVVGRGGREALKAHLPLLRKLHEPDLIIVNGENASGGLGLNAENARELILFGADCLTLGDHAFDKKDLMPLLNDPKFPCIRPCNMPPEAPGKSFYILRTKSGVDVAVTSAIGRVFIDGSADCPFRGIDSLLQENLSSYIIRFCDFHAEASSEKVAFGLYVDGRISAVAGTHTHVQTADNRVLPLGTAYISDAGMCGPQDGVIGMDKNRALNRFIHGFSQGYAVADGSCIVCGVIIKIDAKSGKSLSIDRIFDRL